MSATDLLGNRAETDALLAGIEPPRPLVWGMRGLAVLAVVAGTVGAFAVEGRDQAATFLLLSAMAAPWLVEAAGVTVPRAAFSALVLAPPLGDAAVRLLLAGPGGWRSTGSFGVGGSSSIYLVMLLLLSGALGPRRQLVGTAVAALAVYGLRGALETAPYSRVGWAMALLFTLTACAGVRVGAVGIARAQRAAVARDAADRRRRMARDVHDVVAHTLAVTMLHVTAARMALVRADAAGAVEALDEAERSGRSSLGDVRRVTWILRDGGDDGDDAAPPARPTLADVPALVDDYASAGLEVRAAVTGPLDEVAPAVGRTVYRVAQEALANAARHGDGSVAVQLRVGGGRVVLDVRNPTRRPAPTGSHDDGSRSGSGSGRSGLGGMRERAGAVGAELTAGGTADGHGWQVRLEAAAG